MNSRHFLAFVFIAISFPAMAHAELRVAQIFQDNMVLQREMKVPVWGWADAKAEVKVSFAGQEKSATASDKGYWLVELDALKADTNGQSLTIKSGASTIERKNVLVGEVWVLAGQSNMARPLKNESLDFPFYKDYANDAEYPQIRFMPFGGGATREPLDDVEPFLRKDAPWKILSKSTAMDVMSIGFFFSKIINKELKVPVGLVQVAVSGTPQTAWMPKEAIETFPGGPQHGQNYYQSNFAEVEGRLKGKFKSFADYEKLLDDWRKDPAATERSWPGDQQVTDFPSVLYNTRVAPLIPLAFRGMLWHQGEAGPGGAYGERMVASIKRQRELFKNDFHFIFGTLTRKTMLPPPLEPQLTTHGILNQSMIKGDELFGDNGRGTLVNFFDLGDTSTHWARKEEAGRRMAMAALDRVYGQKHLFTGPQLVESKINGAQITAKFRYVGDGLKYTPSIDGISGVVIIDKKNVKHWADVKVTAPDTLTISSPKVPDPVAVYYGFHNNPHETLFNSADLPAFSFQVGSVQNLKSEDPAPLLQMSGAPNDKTDLNVSHVRREGYNFTVVEIKGAAGAPVKIQAYIPAEWQGAEMVVDGKVSMLDKTMSENGKKYVEVMATVNGPQITVAEQGKGEALAKVKRP